MEKGPRFSGGRTNKEGTHVLYKSKLEMEVRHQIKGRMLKLDGRYSLKERYQASKGALT